MYTLSPRALALFSILYITTLLTIANAESPVITYDDAVKYCDTHPIDNVEGIWQITGDNVSVFIRKKDNTLTSDYTITVVDCHDAFTSCGEVIGTLQPTADDKEYKLTLYTLRDNKSGLFSTPDDCLAKLTQQGCAMVFSNDSKRKFKISFNPLALLPRFWRIIRITPETQTEQYKRGMIKEYPTYDHNGSYRHIPRYL